MNDINSLSQNIEYLDNRPNITVLLETESTKEIRIIMKKGVEMKEHQTPFPIVVEVFEGEIEFGVNGEILNLTRGNLIALEGSVPHNLVAKENSIVRLSLSKLDSVERVKKV